MVNARQLSMLIIFTMAGCVSLGILIYLPWKAFHEYKNHVRRHCRVNSAILERNNTIFQGTWNVTLIDEEKTSDVSIEAVLKADQKDTYKVLRKPPATAAPYNRTIQTVFGVCLLITDFVMVLLD